MRKKVRTFLTVMTATILLVFIANLSFSSETATLKDGSIVEKVSSINDYELESRNPEVIVDNLVKEGKVEEENANTLKESFKGIIKAKDNDERALHTVNALETTGLMSNEKADNMRTANKGPGKTAFLWNFFGYLGAFAAIILISVILSA